MVTKKVITIVLGIVLLLTISPMAGFAEVPQSISYQGYLKDSTDEAINGSVVMAFYFYDAGKNPLWNTDAMIVEVDKGIYNVIIQVPPDHVYDKPYYLGVKVGNDDVMTPFLPLTSVFYSLTAARSETLEGLDSSAFISTNGGTMTGSLNLPENGLRAGNNQLVLSGGNVGIGTSIPKAALEIANTGVTETPNEDYFQLRLGGSANNGANASGYKLYICGYDNDDLEYTYPIYAEDENNSVDFYLRSKSSPSGTSTAYFQGDVGIGITEPEERLSVLGDIGIKSNTGRLVLQTPSRNHPSRNAIQFKNNSSALFLGDDTQDQGFGFYSDFSKTRTYDAHLRVHGRSTDTWGAYLKLTHDGTNGIISTDIGDVVLSPAECVGIGTSNPQQKLDVNGTVRMSGLQLTNSPTPGHVLTCNELGEGSWQPPGEFTLPYSGSISSDMTALKVQNNGTGTAIEGKITNQFSNHTGYSVRGSCYIPYGNGYGVLGWACGHETKPSYGVYGEVGNLLPGTRTSGFGVFGKNAQYDNWGYLGSEIYAVYGKHKGGNTGYIGGSKHGVYGSSQYSDGYGVYAINYNGGIGVYAESSTIPAGVGLYAKGGTEGYAAQLEGDVKVYGTTTTNILEITGGLDLSERFEIQGHKDAIEPVAGMVVSIDPKNPGGLVVSSEAYDRKVAGILSGAGNIKTGMVMGDKDSRAEGAMPVALSGRVYCLTDASHGQVSPGDLLTTSNTPGHIMKVKDYQRAQGAIIGKAMTPLEKGQGLVLVLVNLQ